MKGRGALKDVLRVYGNVTFEEMNRITKHIPDEAKISDELQEMKEETGEASIIRWALENNSEKLKEWCYIDDNNELQGPLAKRFEQAIRLEGTKTNQSKHAAGIAMSSVKLFEICPMVYDGKNDQSIAGMEMQDLEAIGVIKFDILGIALLDKVMGISDLLKCGV
jgi:DNA polymerase-3 subunit alpha